jgi:ribosome-associated translation inhibitor RaiA
MIASNIEKQEANHVPEKLKQMKRKYDSFINVVPTLNKKDNREKDNVQKESPYVATARMEIGTP